VGEGAGGNGGGEKLSSLMRVAVDCPHRSESGSPIGVADL